MYESLHKCLTQLSCDKAAKKAEALFVLPADFPAFNGHFPGQPVFPAFVQLVAVRLLATKISGRPLFPKKTGKIKFSAMVGPEQEICVSVELTRQDADWQAGFVIKRGADKVASGSIVYAELA